MTSTQHGLDRVHLKQIVYVNKNTFYNDVYGFGQLPHLSLFVKKNGVWKIELPELNQIDARNGHFCSIVMFSQSKPMGTSEEKRDKDMTSVISKNILQ